MGFNGQNLTPVVTRLDNLGIVGGIIKDLGIVDFINDRLKDDVRSEISPGIAIAGMIINGLGFTSKPLCLTPEFFQGKPLELLFGKDIQAEHFNRSKLGRILDRIFEYGCENLFFEISSNVCIKEKIDMRFNSLDTTLISVDGAYEDGDEKEVHIAHGYSKDRRPDLKQVVHELLVSQDGGVPIAMKSWDGNAKDNEIFKLRSKELISKFGSVELPRYLIADSKLYTKDNCEYIKDLQFITRIPRVNKEERQLVKSSFADNAWTHVNNKFSYREYCVEHHGINQRWIVVLSMEAKQRATFRINKQVKNELTLSSTFNKEHEKIYFACKHDAERELEELNKLIHYHKVESKVKLIQCQDECRYTVEVKLSELSEYISEQIDINSCYTLGTNIVQGSLSSVEVILAYKGQNQSIENMGFRFLKDPVFFTSSLFLKKNSRIEALLCIMTLSLLIYSIAQRRARLNLLKREETVTNQIKKPQNNPTARWLFQLVDAINIVQINIGNITHMLIEGMNQLKWQVVSLFGEVVENIYKQFSSNLNIVSSE